MNHITLAALTLAFGIAGFSQVAAAGPSALNLTCAEPEGAFQILISASVGDDHEAATTVVLDFYGAKQEATGALAEEDLAIGTAKDDAVSTTLVSATSAYPKPGVVSNAGMLQIRNDAGTVTAVVALNGLVYSAPCK